MTRAALSRIDPRLLGQRLAGAGKDILAFFRYAAGRFVDDRCTAAAAGLTYTSLLSMVPLMTISIAIFAAFPAFAGLRQTAQDFVFDRLVPQVGDQVSEYLQQFTANAGQLTAVGIVGLVVTSVLLLATIEASFNNIWRAQESRPLLVRILSFWAILTLTPLLFGAGLSLTLRFVDSAGANGLSFLSVLTGSLPWVLAFLGLLVVYQIIPNRPVRWSDSAAGAFVAASLFEISKALFGSYLAASPIYQTLYGALATVPIFLVWVYLVWSIVLLGAVVAASLPEWRGGRKVGSVLDKLLAGPKLTLAVAVMRELQVAQKLGVGVTQRTLMRRIPVGLALLDGILFQLREAHFVERTAGGAWLLTRDPGATTVFDLIRGLGIGMRGPIGHIPGIEGAWQDRLARLADEAGGRQRDILGVTLLDLLEEERSAPVAAAKPASRTRHDETATGTGD